MKIHFQKIDAGAAFYPKPKVSVNSYLDISCLLSFFLTKKASLFNVNAIHLLNGTNALTHALKLSGASAHTSILIPAYHCGSMVEPVIWLNAEVLFYKLKADLTPDFQDIKNRAKINTVAMVVPHYFGLPQKLKEISLWCNENKITLIEDCAHAFWGKSEGRMLGSVGDYAISSCRKFFPCAKEGMIVSARHTLEKPAFTPMSPKHQFKEIINCIEIAIKHFGPIRKIINNKKSVLQSGTSLKKKLNNEEMAGFKWFNPESLYSKPSRFSVIMTKLNMTNWAAEKRRNNYTQLLEASSAMHRVTAFLPELPENAVPYVFPLVLHYPDIDFPKLKNAGVPMFRWDELAESHCSISQEYRLKLIQIPCHQSLDNKQIEWIIYTLIGCLNKNREY